MAVHILNIGIGTDGDGRKWPKHHYERNDAYFLGRLAEMWIKDLSQGPKPGVSYKLDRLPPGYAGFERARPDSKHVDRYIYGHPNGQFRSLVEFYPHFKNLMDRGSSAGCECIKCIPIAKKAKELPERRSKYFSQTSGGSTHASASDIISPMRPITTSKKCRYDSEDYELPTRKDVDLEGTADVYEKLIQRLKDAGPEGNVDEKIMEKMSPDWRAAHDTLTDTLQTIRSLPMYAPRIGELVMFVRKLGEGVSLAWDNGSDSFKRVDLESLSWQSQPKWEVGLVTQMPQEDVVERDLITNNGKEQSIIYSGFKVEPLSAPGNEAKPHTGQYKHVPLHALRPFALWRDCLRGTLKDDWHPTVHHALTIASSLCPIARHRFAGTWPNASVFCRALYLGAELIMVGDTVRLMAKSGEQRANAVTEIMVVTSIRLRFVNLDFDEDDLAPTAPDLPYQTAVHISGKVFTTDPSRSFNGESKEPIDPTAYGLPLGLAGYGPWYNRTDSKKPGARIEVPFSRILGRCYEYSAMNTLFTSPTNIKTEMQPPAFKAVNVPKEIGRNSGNTSLLSKGLAAVKEARRYSREHDGRLTSAEQPWFWADTRIEQLDLHEVNDRFVGAKDPMRTREQLTRWHKAIKGLDGKKGALEEYEAARKQRIEQERAALQSKGGMMGCAAVDTEMESIVNGDSAETQGEEEDGNDDDDEREDANGDDMDLDQREKTFDTDQGIARTAAAIHPQTATTIDLMDSESEEEMAQNQLVGELFKKIRTGGS